MAAGGSVMLAQYSALRTVHRGNGALKYRCWRVFHDKLVVIDNICDGFVRPLLQRFNEAEVALPWFEGRRVVMGFAARSQRVSNARPVLPKPTEVGSGFVEGCGGVWCQETGV